MKGERATTWNKLRNSVAIVPRLQNMSSKISAFLEKESWSHKAQMHGPSRQMAWRRNRRKKQGETAGKGTKPHDSAALETLAPSTARRSSTSIAACAHYLAQIFGDTSWTRFSAGRKRERAYCQRKNH